MQTDGMTLRLERVKARVRVTDLARQMRCARSTLAVYETAAAVRPEVVRRYRQALSELADIAERATA